MASLSYLGSREIVLCSENKGADQLRSYLNEPRCEKTGLGGFRPGPTQTGLYNH